MAQATALSPAALGYRMPAEWEPHAGTWLTWPRPDGISFPGKYEPVPDAYAAFIDRMMEEQPLVRRYQSRIAIKTIKRGLVVETD